MSIVNKSRHGRYSVSIFVNGKRAQELIAGASGKVTTYWIESKPGAEFAIHVTEHPSAATYSQSRVDVFADGKEVGKSILKPGETCRFLGSWLDSHSLRPFVFTKTNEAAQIPSKFGNKLGSIQVKVSEVIVISEFLDPPPPLPEFDATIKGKQLQHRIGLSEKARDQQYPSQVSRFTTLSFDPHSPDPIAEFDIFYRPRECLVSRGYLEPSWRSKTQSGHLRVEVAIDTMPTKRSYAMHLEDKQVTLPQQEKRPRAQVETLDFPCSRCAVAGTGCIRLTGKKACSRCSDRKQRCDPGRRPRVTKIGSSSSSQKTANVNLNGSADGAAEQERSDTASDPKDSHADDHSSDDGTYDEGNKSQLPSSVLAKGKTRNAKKTIYATERQIDPDAQEVNEHLNVSDGGDNDISTSTTNIVSTTNVESGTQKSQSLPKAGKSSNPKLPISEIGQATNLLATMRKWSDDLMEFVVDGDEEGYIAVVAKDLIKELEGRYRSLQAESLKSNRLR